jgi:hypothetical protein
VRVHEVRPGDSPAQIAIEHAGCPKCAIDLVHSNPHKPTVTHPNGFKTFAGLRVGEKLALPDKWFNGDLDSRPQAYFSALPYSDGVTPSTLGDAAAGVLGTYAALDAASARVNSLPQMDITAFSSAVNDACLLIDQSVAEVSLSGNSVAIGHAQDTVASTAWALQRNVQLAVALKSGDADGAAAARSGIQDVLSTALNSARLALQAFYDPPPAAPPVAAQPSSFPAVVTAAAQAAATAMAADPNYCTAVAQTGSAVNSAIHAFKLAWNASQSPPVPLGTGNYEQATAEVLASVLGGAPLPCDPHVGTPSSIKPPVAVATQAPKQPISAGAVAGIGLLAAGAIGGAVYLATRRQ